MEGTGERDDLIAEAIKEAFGERCPDFDKDCWCCKAWKQYDDLLATRDEHVGKLQGDG